MVEFPNFERERVDKNIPLKKTPFTTKLFHEGCISTLYGLPESGKTNFMVFLSQCAAMNKFNIFTVIHFFDMSQVEEAIQEKLLPPGIKYIPVPKRIHTVKKVSELILGVLDGTNNATILDEAGLFASTRAPMSKKLRYILNLSYIIRHLRSSFVYVTQTKRSIPPEMRESLVTYEMNIKKTTEEIRTLVIKKRKTYHDMHGNDYIDFVPIDTVHRLPLTVLPWDGHYIPKFEFDIDLDKTWNILGDYNSLDVRKVGRKVVQEMIDSSKEEDNTKESAETRRIRARKRFEEMYEDEEFETRSEAVTKLSKEFNRSYQWAYQLTKDMFL